MRIGQGVSFRVMRNPKDIPNSGAHFDFEWFFTTNHVAKAALFPDS